MTVIETIIRGYQSTFGEAPAVVAQAPGRVNLIGEHTDYNEGLVLPFAIDRTIQVAAGPGKWDVVSVHSAAMGEAVTFPGAVLEPTDKQPCRSNTHEYMPLDLQAADLFVVPSGVKHELSCGAYAQRVQECHEVVASLSSVKSSVRALRDVTEELLGEFAVRIDPVAAKRAHHVVMENLRVAEAVAALRSRRMEDLGQLLNTSHDSLRDNYEVSCSEIEALIAVLRADKDVLGVRMVGGGFGGTVVALVRKGAARRRSDRCAGHRSFAPGCGAEAQLVYPAAGAFCRNLETGTE